jgi:hypothetical protein
MREIRDNATTQTVEEAADLHITLLQARDDTSHLASPVITTRDAMLAAAAKEKAARLARLLLSATVVYEDSVLDKLIADLARRALAEFGQRADARYTSLFTSAPSAAMRPVGGDDQDDYVDNIVTRLTNEPAYAALSHLAGAIEGQQIKLNDLRAKRDAALRVEGAAETDLKVARARAIDAIHHNHPRLKTLFPDDDSLVESFFAQSTY